jgi:hypothetical protein
MIRDSAELMDGPVFGKARPATLRTPTPICTLVIDAEEDFDWRNPLAGTDHSTSHIQNITTLHEILIGHGIVPAYLVTYPVLEDKEAVRLLNRQLENGRCVLGTQLHPWVNPPFERQNGQRASFQSNLGAELEERKLDALERKFIACFGHAPRIYKAGRYGLSRRTTALLEARGFAIDTSLAPRTSFAALGGPDYTGYDCRPFWFGERRRILELPLCRSVVGWAGALAPPLYQAFSRPWPAALHAPAVLTRSRFAERITLSPEGNDLAAMIRLVRRLGARGQTIFTLSFHSSSLQAGRNPYVRSQRDLQTFYARLRGVLDHLAGAVGCEFQNPLCLPELLAEPAAGESRRAAAYPGTEPGRAACR